MKKKILIVKFRHETNSFCPNPANEQAFRNLTYEIGESVFESDRGKGNPTGAFLDVLENCEEFELIPTVALVACPSGPVTADVYDFVVSEVTKVISQHDKIDGVLFDCHGAMVAEGHPDGEGDLFEIVRNLVGKDVPFVASLDLHANITEKMAKHAAALVPFECYPHTDNYETGHFAAEIMRDTLLGKLNPVMAYRRIPFLLPLFPSAFPEMRVLYDFAKKLEETEGVRQVRFSHGFFPADIEEMGMAVMVVTDGDKELAEKVADEMAEKIKENIPNLKRTYISLDEALDIACNGEKGPVAIGDASDNPGAGGVGDTTHILRRILERGITGAAIATIVDPESVKACISAGVGSTVKLSLGGYTDASKSGGPLEVEAYVKMITDGKYTVKGKMSHGTTAKHGKIAVVDIAGNTVLIASVPKQAFDLEVYRSHGITPEDQKILVTKSAIHYRASYGEVARELISVSLPGYSTPVPEGFEYKNWKN